MSSDSLLCKIRFFFFARCFFILNINGSYENKLFWNFSRIISFLFVLLVSPAKKIVYHLFPRRKCLYSFSGKENSFFPRKKALVISPAKKITSIFNSEENYFLWEKLQVLFFTAKSNSILFNESRKGGFAVSRVKNAQKLRVLVPKITSYSEISGFLCLL